MLMVLLFAILVCLCIILLACMWKLVRIFTKVQVEKQIEELDELLKLLQLNQSEGSEQHLNSNEEFIGTGYTLSEEGKYKVRK